MASAVRYIFVISDASGLSAQRLIKALIQQFDMCAIDYDACGGAAVPCEVHTLAKLHSSNTTPTYDS